MKNKIIFTLFVSILTLFCFFGVARAQALGVAQESIENFNSIITVNADNSVDVRETIIYNTGQQERHGIYRDIYPYSSVGKKMTIDNINVVDENKNAYIFTISNSGENIRIKIGDPNQTFTGQKIYILEYHATKAVAQFKDFDEIYWNVTGNDWPMPIYRAQAFVVLPNGANKSQSSCYYGPKGSTNQCQLNTESGTYGFNAPLTLNPNEGLTVAVGFQKGVVVTYSGSDTVSDFFDKYWRWLVSGILPILTLIFSLLYWYKKGRDPKGTGVIVPQYDVPYGLTPMEVGGIVKEKVVTENISAEIIYLATKGYLKINQLEEKFMGFIKRSDYELIKLKDFSDLQNDFDKKLLDSLFDGKLQTVKLSKLKNVFYKHTKTVIDSVLDNLLNKGYYKNLGRMKSSGGRIFVIGFMSIWASIFLGGIIGDFVLGDNPFPMMIGIFLSIIVYGIISHFSPSKTEKGVAIKEYLLGLKNYLQIAEKDRLLFHNAPDKKPEVFEKLLPYAMVLGVANIWAKEFEGIYITPPSWYSGPNNTVFNAVIFTHSLSNFNSFASSSMTSSPSGSGSGGGGSSGGGGGGGGGGGW